MSKQKSVVSGLTEAGKVFDYYAFISYKHLDKKWAIWVQKHLEHYRLPNRLCREQRTPRHVSPIFRDETDLAGGKSVREHLLQKIGQSKYLIVVCSRHMQVEPKYIDYEIESFLAAGNPPARILPLIVDGEANSPDPEKECLPPALKRMAEEMPLGITVNHKNRREAILKLIASILELDLQALRSHNQERKQRRIMAALGGGLAVSLGLGAFMAWEVLSVKQASLREQLTYAADTFRQGDRLDANAQARSIEAEYIPLMDETIREEADKLTLLSAIRPKYQPMTRLCEAAADSRLLFDTTGQHVMVITESAVRKFDMQGREVMAFDISQIAHRIVDVCVDGVHAVVMTTYLPELDGTRLWLWNMETDEPVCQLVYSAQYDQDDTKKGYLSGVVNAQFSPDGRMVCAYRDAAGYYNANDELAAWDVQTGEKLFSFSGELLGQMNQPYEVEAFEFIGQDTFHWTGSANHVYYTLGEDEPVVISKRSLPSVRDKSTVSIGHGRYTLARTDTSSLVRDLATGKTLEYDNAGLDIHAADYEGRYLFLYATKNNDLTQQVVLIDLETMTEMPCSAAIAELCRGRRLTFTHHLPGSPYVYLSLNDMYFYRLDMTTGEYVEIDTQGSADYTPIAWTGSMEILAASVGGRLDLVEVEGNSLRGYTIDEDYGRFTSSAAFSDGGYMAANHNGDYYLYPLVNPGTQLDAGMAVDGESEYAVSQDGAVVVKGTGATLTAWKNGQMLMQEELPSAVLRVAAADGRIMALTKEELRLYDGNGTLVGQYSAPAETAFRSAKMTEDGRRIALLQGYDSQFSDNACELILLEGAGLEMVTVVSSKVHVIPSGVYETAYDLSPDGKWLSAVVRVSEPDSVQYQLTVSVWSVENGVLHAQAQNINNDDVPVFDLIHYASGIASAHRLQYVHFARSGKLLSGLQYGVWIFDVEAQQTVTFISEGGNCDALPDMIDGGTLLYPTNGLHVWDTNAGRLQATLTHLSPVTGVDAMLKAANQDRIYISGDQQWVAVGGAEDTWLYHAGDWSSGTVLAAQRAQVLHLDKTQLVYATGDGLWRLTYDEENEKEMFQ